MNIMYPSTSLLASGSSNNVQLALFEMHGAREIIELSAGAMHIERVVTALENAIPTDPGLAIDFTKALVETVCITILKDRGYEPQKDDMPGLLKETLKKLQMVSDGCNDAARISDGLKKTVNGLTTVIQGLCELRNNQGFASHGKDGYALQSLEVVQVHLAARAADAVVNFLFKTHKKYSISNVSTRLIYKDNQSFNDYVDNSNSVTIFDLNYSPSEVLYQVDIEAYRELLTEYAIQKAEEDISFEAEIKAFNEQKVEENTNFNPEVKATAILTDCEYENA